MSTHLFLDFDGTISNGDIGDELFRTFGSFEPVHSQLIAGDFSVAEYYRQSVALLRSDCTPEAIVEFCDGQSLDAGFAPLVDWYASVDIAVTVVSDGFDAYISPLLKKSGLRDQLKVICNVLEWNDEKFTPSFPGASESCTCFCASCKRNAVINRIGDQDIAIYVGDGRSDACAVEYADVVFAKSSLAAECTRKGIPHHPYRTLSEVRIILQEKVGKGALRTRRQAQLARKRAFEAE